MDVNSSVEIIGPSSEDFPHLVASLLGRESDDVLLPALPFSAIARNRDLRAIALLGVRFDLTGASGKNYAVVHYADTLRHPENAALEPGALRFVCAEQLYTDYVLRRQSTIDARGPLSLTNLRKAADVRASVDCVAFADGEFAGPDSLSACSTVSRASVRPKQT